jgi:hypothetical protein
VLQSICVLLQQRLHSVSALLLESFPYIASISLNSYSFTVHNSRTHRQLNLHNIRVYVNACIFTLHNTQAYRCCYLFAIGYVQRNIRTFTLNDTSVYGRFYLDDPGTNLGIYSKNYPSTFYCCRRSHSCSIYCTPTNSFWIGDNDSV